MLTYSQIMTLNTKNNSSYSSILFFHTTYLIMIGQNCSHYMHSVISICTSKLQLNSMKRKKLGRLTNSDSIKIQKPSFDSG